MSGEENERKRTHSSEKGEWEREIRRLKSQLKAKDCQLEAKDNLIEEQRVELEAKNSQLKKKDSEIESKSLHSLLLNTSHILELSCVGSRSSHLNPSNHEAATFVPKQFNCTPSELISRVTTLKRHPNRDPKLELRGSQLILKFINNQNITSDTTSTDSAQSPKCSNEAAVACYVNVLLEDVITICNGMLYMSYGTGSRTEPPKLEVRQEMSIFSNRCDHVVVFDSTSNVPIFCVETKKHFGENFAKRTKNRSFGQALDQLHAMSLLGQPCPLGALTCFNKTYFTSLGQEIDWDVLPTLQSLKDTVAYLPFTRQPNSTPSPLKVNTVVLTRQTNSEEKFVADTERHIVRSSECIDHKHVVAAFVIIILNALKGNYCKPKPFELFTKSHVIDRKCIEMSTNAYKWGKITTSYKGPYQNPGGILSRHLRSSRRTQSMNTNLYLLQCIGTGATSKAYHAVTKDGYGCVVKLYVQRYYDDGTMKTKQEFKDDSIAHVSREVKYYKKIYKGELEKYVWQRKLNGMDCVVMPFFDPVPVSQRKSEIPNIMSRLELFIKHNLAFHECDQSWRHIGRFNGQLYLFDLGDLETLEDEEAAGHQASEHTSRLTSKMNASI